MGKRVADVFTDVEELALGASSMAQVHKAKLRKTGEPVVLKL